jgi:hypothetical protein
MAGTRMLRWWIAAGALIVAACLILFMLRRSREVPPMERLVATYEGRFKCTLYYTPRESGFTAEAGFDVSPETRPGLKGKEFPRDFLVAVEKEGFGRLRTPIDGKVYIRHWGGKWSFAERPIDHRQRPLIARQTCAAAASHKLIPPGAKLRIKAGESSAGFEQHRWILGDVGSGLDDWQLDLYWGEDDPLGPGKLITLPKTGPAELAAATVMVFR